jgi:hypothetical protein
VGYLNTLKKQGLPLSEELMALVGINKGAAKSTVWMAIHFSNENWSLVPSAIEPSLNAKYLVQQPNATLPNAQAMSALGTGIVKNITGTGVQSIATANVDYEAASAALTSIAGLTTAADKMIYTTASNVYAVTDLTSAGRAILDDTTAAAQLATIGGQAALSGSSLTAVTVATDDKVLIQDTSDSNNLKTVTAQSIANLAPGGAGVFTQLSVTVTPTEMKTVLSNPGKLIIPAQGANKLIVVNSVVYEYTYNSVVYAAGDVVYLAYDAIGGWFLTVGIPAVDFQQPASPTIQDLMKPQDAYTGNGVAINKDIYMFANSNFTNGDSTVTVHVTYQVITTVNT